MSLLQGQVMPTSSQPPNVTSAHQAASLSNLTSLILTSIRRADGSNATVNKNLNATRNDFDNISSRASDLFEKINNAHTNGYLSSVLSNLSYTFSCTGVDNQLTKFTVYQDIISSIDNGKFSSGSNQVEQNEALNVISRLYTDIFNTMAVSNSAREFLKGISNNESVFILFKSVIINAFSSCPMGVLADIEQVITNRRNDILDHTLTNVDDLDITIALLTVIKSDLGLSYDIKTIEQFLIQYNTNLSGYKPRDILRVI